MTIRVGDSLIIDNDQFRIIYITPTTVVLCQMGIQQLNLVEDDLSRIVKEIETKNYSLLADHDTSVVEVNKLSEAEAKSFLAKKALVLAVGEKYGPSFLELQGKTKKPEVDRILSDAKISRKHFWTIIRTYLQSGLKDSSLVRKKRSTSENENNKEKRGRKGALGITAGCFVDENVLAAFEDGLKYYLSGRAITYAAAFDKMNSDHFSAECVKDGVYEKTLLPENQRPTFRQFTYFCNKRVTEEQKDIKKTSKMEVRNNKRLLIGAGSDRIEYPGEKVECDAVEFDLSLVSMVDPTQTVGRPIMYVMRDVLTHAVVAFSVAFDNNSNIGLSNLLLNLGDDKHEFCQKNGVTLEDPRLWPSNFIPQELYADRGSDFKSDPFGRVCKELGITRHLVSGGSGSLKGMVESWFHQMHSMINPHTENYGLIEKRYDSEHHKEATLNIAQFTKMAIICVLSYNQMHMDGYRPRLEEIQNNIDSTPALLWEYYCGAKGSPRPITDRASYLMKLLVPAQAKVSRKGIEFRGLTYINQEDEDLVRQMYHQQSKKTPIDVRYDPRDNSRLYYVDKNNHLILANINERLGWQEDLAGMTWTDTSCYMQLSKKSNREAEQRNAEIRTARFGVVEGIVQEARQNRPPVYSNNKNLQEARAKEKQLISRENAITDRLQPPQLSTVEKTKPVELKSPDKVKELTEDEYLNLVANFDDLDDE